SSERRCPLVARADCSSESRTPASTVQVRSPGSCSRIRSSPPVVRSAPIRSRRPSACAAARAAEASSALETLGNADPLQGVYAIGARNLAAQPGRGDDLARVADAARVERASQSLEHAEGALREHPRHGARLVHADAVLTRQRATGIDARLEDGLGELARARSLTRSRVVEHERMEVAVARVEDVADE